MKNLTTKNLTTRNLMAILIILSNTQPLYAAQKLRDLSLSVEQTNEQLRNPPVQSSPPNGAIGGVGANSGTGFDDNVPLDPDMARQLREINSRNNNNNNGQATDLLKGLPVPPLTATGTLPPAHRGQSQQNYINQFCNTPINNNSQSCQENQRQQACERFSRATVNVQRILSQAIDCELNTTGIIKSGCDGLDAGRLDLLKQYWQDEDMSYTILFLPDMVINVQANCAAKK